MSDHTTLTAAADIGMAADSSSDTAFNLEIPINILKSFSDSLHGNQFEMSGYLYGNEGSKAELEVRGENKKNVMCFTLRDKQKLIQMEEILRKICKCEITSIISSSVGSSACSDITQLEDSSKLTAPKNNATSIIETSATQNVQRKRGRPRKDADPKPTVKCQRKQKESQKSVTSVEESTVKQETPLVDYDSDSMDGGGDFNDINDPVEDLDFSVTKRHSVTKKTNTKKRNAAHLDKTVDDESADSVTKVPCKKTKSKKNIPSCQELSIEQWTEAVSNACICRVCDQHVAEIAYHVKRLHDIDWATYQQTVLVIEQDFQKRFLRKKVMSNLESSVISKPAALKMLNAWREAQSERESTKKDVIGISENASDTVTVSLPKQKRTKKPFLINNVPFIPCQYCEKVFKRASNLASHLRAEHNDEISEREDVATRRSLPREPGSNSKYGHLFEQNTARCQELGIISSVHHGTGCLLCAKTFSGSSSASRFIKHLTEKHLVALTKYQQLLDLDVNARKSLTEEILKEEQDQKVAKKSNRLGSDSTTFVQCPGCEHYYNSYHSLTIHVRKKHRDDPNFSEIYAKVEESQASSYKPNLARREELEIRCPVCQAQRVGRSIIKHVRAAHGTHKDITQLLKTVENDYDKLMKSREAKRKVKSQELRKSDGTKYNCKFCGREFNCGTTRHRHSKYQCTDNPNKAKSYFCSCGRRCGTPQALQTHKGRCSAKGRQYQCHLCGRVYNTRAGIYSHRRVAHSDKQYKHVCPICNKRFYQKHHFDRHIAIHTDDRKYQCELCGKQYKTPDAVKKHQTAVHLNKYPYYCKLCGHGVAKKSYLTAHKCGNVRRVQSMELIKGGVIVKDNAIHDAKTSVVHVIGDVKPSICYNQLEVSQALKVITYSETNTMETSTEDAAAVAVSDMAYHKPDPGIADTVLTGSVSTEPTTTTTHDFSVRSMLQNVSIPATVATIGYIDQDGTYVIGNHSNADHSSTAVTATHHPGLYNTLTQSNYAAYHPAYYELPPAPDK